MSIVEEYIEELVEKYRKRRRAIPPSEFREMLKNLVETVYKYH